MSNHKRTGKCLCGTVSYEVTLESDQIHICHCNLCQKWHGGPGVAAKVNSDWKIEGEESVTWFDSSEWAQRAFCSKCGSHLFFKTHSGDYYGVAVGAFDNKEGLKIENHLFIDKKPDCYDFADDAPRLTEEEFLKMVGA